MCTCDVYVHTYVGACKPVSICSYRPIVHVNSRVHICQSIYMPCILCVCACMHMCVHVCATVYVCPRVQVRVYVSQMFVRHL